MKKQVFTNVLFSLIYQLVYAISGIIVPKLLLNTFGSEVNGLISSLSSFLSVFVVIEGGMTAVIGAQLYKPLIEHDDKTFSKVVISGRCFYKKLAVCFAVFSLGLAIVYPIVKHTSFSFPYIFFLVLILAATPFISYYTHVISSTILYADNKSYITFIAYTIAAILNVILVLFGITIFPNIHFIKILSLISYLLNPIILRKYIKKHYKIDTSIKSDNAVLKQRWDGFAHNLSTFIMNNVDVYVLTFFSSLINVSIYSIYSIIVSSIKQLVNTVTSVLTPFLGRAKAAEKNIDGSFNIQIFISGIVTVIIFSCTYVLINPFISIYTVNIHDANYINPSFAFLFVTSEMLACLTFPYINISYAEGDFKNTKYLAYTEVIVNILFSILLVFKLGITGVIVATLIARLVRFIMQIMYLKRVEKDIDLKCSILKSIEKMIMIIIIVLILDRIIVFNSFTYLYWFFNGILSFVISLVLCILFSLIFDRKMTISIFNYVIDTILKHK